MDVKENEIAKLNPDISKTELKIGQEIKIPGVQKIGIDTIKKDTLKLTTLGNETIPKKVEIHTGENDFKIALFLPFYLSTTPYIEVDKIKKGLTDFPDRSRIAIEFYQGAVMAIDSLKTTGINVVLHVYATGADSPGMVDISKIPQLKSTNLIVAPLYTTSFLAMSQFARVHAVPIVSPL